MTEADVSGLVHRLKRSLMRRASARLPGVLTVLCAAMIALATDPTAAFSQETQITQYHIKAAFLYNFAKFVDWPSTAFRDPTTPFTLCIAGAEAFISARETLVGKTIKGRNVSVRRVDNNAALNECHMLFMAEADDVGAELDVARIKGKVLTVGESDDFLKKGGLINLKTVDNKIRFELDRDSGEQLGFKFRAQLLQRAILVDRRG